MPMLSNGLKDFLFSAVRYNVIKAYVNAEIDDSIKGKEKKRYVAALDGKPDETLLDLIFRSYTQINQTRYLLRKPPGSTRKLVLQNVSANLRRSLNGASGGPSVARIEERVQGEYWTAVVSKTIKLFPINEAGEPTSSSPIHREIFIPVRLRVIDNRFLMLNLCNSSISKNNELLDGHFMFQGPSFDSQLYNELKGSVLPKVLNTQVESVNITTGLKYMIRNRQISAISAEAEDPTREYLERRTKNSTIRGSFVPFEWLMATVHASPRITKGNWYWIDGNQNPSPDNCQRFTVDCERGIIEQDYASESDLDWFSERLLANS